MIDLQKPFDWNAWYASIPSFPPDWGVDDDARRIAQLRPSVGRFLRRAPTATAANTAASA